MCFNCVCELFEFCFDFEYCFDLKLLVECDVIILYFLSNFEKCGSNEGCCFCFVCMWVSNKLCVVVYHGVFGDLYLLVQCVGEQCLCFVYYVLCEGA